MAYTFKHIEHRVYQNTFLKDVRIAVEFPKIAASDVDVPSLQAYFSKFKKANIKTDDFLERGFINIFSDNHEIDFKFSLSFAEAKLCTPPFTSFKDAESFWTILIDFLDAMGIVAVNRLVVRKYNALYFKTNTPDYDIREVMGGLFCDELMRHVNAQVGKDKSLNSFERTWSMSDSDSGSEVNVVYGIKKADATEGRDCLTLVTLVKSTAPPISVTDVMKRAREYNQILFDVFHWCVREDIINNMK